MNNYTFFGYEIDTDTIKNFDSSMEVYCQVQVKDEFFYFTKNDLLMMLDMFNQSQEELNKGETK